MTRKSESELLDELRLELDKMLFDDDAIPKLPDGTEEPQQVDGEFVDMMEHTDDLGTELIDPIDDALDMTDPDIEPGMEDEL